MRKRIGLAITEERPEGLSRAKRAMKHCEFVGQALGGERFYAENSDISCPLARYNLGLERPGGRFVEELAETLVGWDDARDRATALKFLRSRHRLPFKRRYILYLPLPNSDHIPDVTIEIFGPEDLMHRLREMTCLTGESVAGPAGGVGAMCGECTAYPIMTGKPNVSLGCTGSRPGAKLKRDELLLAIPKGHANDP